jgi:hypothetical protein
MKLMFQSEVAPKCCSTEHLAEEWATKNSRTWITSKPSTIGLLLNQSIVTTHNFNPIHRHSSKIPQNPTVHAENRATNKSCPLRVLLPVVNALSKDPRLRLQPPLSPNGL